jgi:hypothetical protein
VKHHLKEPGEEGNIKIIEHAIIFSGITTIKYFFFNLYKYFQEFEVTILVTMEDTSFKNFEEI